MTLDSIISLIVTAGLLVYLTYALLKPEKFLAMTANGWFQIGVYLLAVLAVTPLIGRYMTRVFTREPTWLDGILRPIERAIYRLTGVDETCEMRWTEYAFALLA